MKDLAQYIIDHPHNKNCYDRFWRLFEYAYQNDKSGQSPEEFAQACLDAYGGVLADALIDYIYNHK